MDTIIDEIASDSPARATTNVTRPTTRRASLSSLLSISNRLPVCRNLVRTTILIDMATVTAHETNNNATRPYVSRRET